MTTTPPKPSAIPTAMRPFSRSRRTKCDRIPTSSGWDVTRMTDEATLTWTPVIFSEAIQSRYSAIVTNGDVDQDMKIAENETETTARAMAAYGPLRTTRSPATNVCNACAAAHVPGGGTWGGGGAYGPGGRAIFRRRITASTAMAIAARTTTPPMIRSKPTKPDWYRYAVSSCSATRFPLPSYDSCLTLFPAPSE